LATVSTAKGLVEKFCVAVSDCPLSVAHAKLIPYLQQRDEEVGVYGFIFFRDNGWVNVVVDECVFY
jgi:hypothetical protein